MLQKFVLDLLVAASKNPDIREFVFELVDRLKDNLLPDLMKSVVPLLPVFGDSLIKAFVDHMPDIPNIAEGVDIAKDVAEKIVAADPDLPFVSDVFDLSEMLKGFLR